MTERCANNEVFSIIQDREGNLWFRTSNGVSRYDGRSFKSFTTRDGLANNGVGAIFQDREGYIWFGTWDGVSRYDGKTWTTFTTKDGLVDNSVSSIFQDRDGNLWFGTSEGVSRYDGRTWMTFTTKDGLGSNWLYKIVQDREGNLWFGTWGGGVTRYSGQTLTSFTTEDGIAHNFVSSIFQDREDNLWFGTSVGVSRYDGKTFTTFTVNDGLVNNRVNSMLQDQEGNLWFGTFGGGVSRYDRKRFTNFTTKEGLADNRIWSMLQDRDGNLWFGTWGGGVTRYDGSTWTTFTAQDGLAGNWVWSMLQDREGYLWFGTDAGMSRYDGKIFQTLNRQDGLAANSVYSTFQNREGSLWFGSLGGLIRYRNPLLSFPPVFIDAVVADQRHKRGSELTISSTVQLVAFEFHAISFKTRPGALIYQYRLKGYDQDWKTTHARRVEYQGLPIGIYTFEVVAVDRDLTYSEKPATVTLRVHPPYGILALAGGLGLALVGLAAVSIYAVKRRRERDRVREALMAEMQKELQTAHEMQMALMPKQSPKIEGLDIAGRCIPANHVGGDYFQYFSQDDRLTLSLADVTGHAMEAAIPVVMFSGLLKSHMELGGSLLERFDRLNRSLYGTLTGRTLVCLAMGEIDLFTRALSLSDSGCPYPYHFRASTGDVIELQVDAYPLGVRPDTAYQVVETQLQPGDRVVLCSDGVAEAVNATGEQFGYERAAEAIRGACEEGLSAEGTIDRILSAVNAFRGDAPQADDMTCVVLRVDRWVEG